VCAIIINNSSSSALLAVAASARLVFTFANGRVRANFMNANPWLLDRRQSVCYKPTFLETEVRFGNI